jgi:hypothetical protein
MRIQFPAPLSRQSGSALLATVLIVGILAAAVGTYLALTAQSNNSVKRSIGWNAALPLAEAGIEEALTHVVRNTNSFTLDGWAFNATDATYSKKRYISDGYYSVSIAGAQGGTVTITSTGYGCWRASNYVARTVQVLAESPFPFIPIGLEATNIGFGGGFTADSFDSSSELYSTDGNYDRNKATALVTVATPGLGFRIAGSSQVRGYVATGPGGSVNIGGAALVGDENFAGHGIQAGHETNNFTATYPTIVAPFTSSTPGILTPTKGTVGGTDYTYVLKGGNYFITNLDSANYGKTLYVASDSTLFVTGNIDLNTVIFNTNSKPRLNLYISAPGLTFTPAVIDGTPPQFWVFGLPSCITMNLAAQKTFIGVIYAPQVNLKANGNAAFCGAIVAATFSCLGGFVLHYDLSTRPIDAKPFKIVSWAEL